MSKGQIDGKRKSAERTTRGRIIYPASWNGCSKLLCSKLLCVVLGVLGGFVSIYSGEAVAEAGWEPAPRFADADQAYLERADSARAIFANERYEALYRADPEDWQAAWRLAMTCYFLGNRVATQKSEKEAFFVQGRDAALEATKLKPDCAPCHLLVGVNTALYAESVGVVKMIFTLRSIRRHLRRSLELDPAFAEGAAARTLGTIDHAVPFFLGGSSKRAQKYYQRALDIDVEEPLNYLFYAYFLESRRELAAALDLTERGLEQPRPGLERLESRDGWDRLERLKAKLQKRIQEAVKPARRLRPGHKRRY